jgi:predicted RNase H-like HicB family nuclease
LEKEKTAVVTGRYFDLKLFSAILTLLMTTRNQFTAVFKKTKDWVIAWIEEIPGVNTQGKTLVEARENLREALLLILETNRRSSRSQIKRSHTARRELIDITLPA